MPSFPTRITRDAFGPDRINKGGLAGDPHYSVNAGDYNTLFWQTSGLGLVGALCRLTFLTATTTGGMSLIDHAEAWDPKRIQAAPTLARTGTGIFTFTFPTQVTDVDGNTVSVVVGDASAHVQTDQNYDAKARATAANVIEVRVRDASGTLADLAGLRVLVVGR